MVVQIPLVLFIVFAAASAGIFGTQAVVAFAGKGQAVQVPSLIAAVIALVIGGVAVFFHLAQPLHIFNGFGNMTSGITQELIAIVVLAVVMVVYFIFLRRNDNAVPKWLAVVAILVSVVLVFVCAHSYIMAARPAWTGALQICSVFGAALGIGPAVVAALAAKSEPECKAGTFAFIGTIIALLLTVAYIISLGGVASSFAGFGTTYIDPVNPTAPIFDASALSPFAAPYLTATIIAIIAAVAAAVFGFLAWKKPAQAAWGWLAACCGLVAAIALRVLFFQLGACVYNFYGITG